MDPTKEPEQYLTFDHDHMAKKCLLHNKSKIDALPGVENYFIGLSSGSSERRPVIVINSSLEGGGEYPDALSVPLDSGKIFLVPVEVVYGFRRPKIHFGTGNSICYFETANVSGTICCGVQKYDKKYFLTCAHVLTAGISTVDEENSNGWFTEVAQNDVRSGDLKFKPVGSWSYGLITSSLDIALVETDIEIESITTGVSAAAIYSPAMNHEEVFVNGNRNKQSGYIMGFLEEELDFEYNGSTLKHSQLIMISRDISTEPVAITEPGDSGALAYLTKDSTPIGMVVGGNDHYTYLIPMHAILTATQTNLI